MLDKIARAIVIEIGDIRNCQHVNCMSDINIWDAWQSLTLRLISSAERRLWLIFIDAFVFEHTLFVPANNFPIYIYKHESNGNDDGNDDNSSRQRSYTIA